MPFVVRSPELPRRRRPAKNPALSVVVLGVKLLPAVLPAYVISLRSGLGLGLGLGWMFVAAAELLGASQGLGYLLLDGQQLGKPAEIVAAIVTLAAAQADDPVITEAMDLTGATIYWIARLRGQ